MEGSGMVLHLVINVFVSILIWKTCDCFPKDLKANLVMKSQDTANLAVFNGRNEEGDDEMLWDIQEIKLINDKIVIGSRNAAYVISRNSFQQATGNIAFDQRKEWLPASNAQSKCKRNTNSEKICQNYIRVIELITTDTMLLCGTNAGEVACREHEWTNSQFSNNAATDSHAFSSYSMPYDDLASLVYRITGGYVFSATLVRLHRSGSSLTRKPVKGNPKPPLARSGTAIGNFSEVLPVLQNDVRAHPKWFSSPDFIGMVDTKEKIFIFFKEEAVDASDPTEKVIHSRVAQVCKRDLGGNDNLLNHKWTSFFKARLNCSYPGDRPFYFNEIHHVTEAVMHEGKLTVFAVMTTPENSIPGSAVCAFTLYNIAVSMAGNFKQQNTSSSCWKEKIPNPPSPNPTICSDERIEKYPTLRFIRSHSFMSDAVPSLDHQPLFMSTQSDNRFTAIAVDPSVPGPGGKNVTVMYIGTRKGTLLKVTLGQNTTDGKRKVTFSEEWEVFKPEKCSRKENYSAGVDRSPVFSEKSKDEERSVRNLTLIPGSSIVLVIMQHCVISVPKEACYHYKCESSCAQSGNPYCGWKSGYCTPVNSASGDDIEQDLFAETNYTDTCVVTSAEAAVSNDTQPCPENNVGYIFPLVVGIVGTFTLILLIFLVYITVTGRLSIWCCPGSNRQQQYTEGTTEKHKNSRKFGRRMFVHRSDNSQPHVSIEPTSPIEPSIRSRPDIGHPQPVTNTNANSNLLSEQEQDVFVVQNPCRNGRENLSGDDTTWSEDLFDSDRSVSELHLAAQTATYQRTPREGIESRYNCNNNRTIGVAHPIKNTHCKKSQVVKPTFVSSNPSRIRLGFDNNTTNYGAVHSSNSSTTSHGTTPRIVTNPNYLPVTPYICRTTSQSMTRETPQRQDFSHFDTSVSTFSAVNDNTQKTRRKLVPEDSCKFDLNFPPPPPDAFSHSKNNVKLKSFSSPPDTSTSLNKSMFPSASENAGSSEYNPPREKSSNDAGRRSSSIGANPISSSASGESTTSGFVSSSPKSSFQDQSASQRKALIVAKGILSAQTSLASPCGKRRNKKNPHSGGSKQNIYDEVDENVYDEVFDDTSPDSKASSSSSKRLSKLVSGDRISFPSPEFFCSSDDDDFDDLESCPPTPVDGLDRVPGEESKSSRSKKALNIFKSRRNKRSKKQKLQELKLQNEETFISPSYDEDPTVPVIEGWEEIDYSSNSFRRQTSPQVNPSGPRSYDDSYVELSGMGKSSDEKWGHDFYTMRPNNRKRQKMPKMRNTGKEWIEANKPVPVPTPAIPNA